MLPTTSETELNAHCDRCRTMHTCPTLNNRNVFTNVHPQRLGHNKMQYLETTADAACEMLKDKFQYVSDQLELSSKQHQAVKGRFVSYLQEHVVIGFNSSCYDIHWRKRTC